MIVIDLFFFFKQKTAYEMRISDWSSDVCSSDLLAPTLVMADPLATLLSYQFLHGGFLHLAGNLLYLWVFGDNVEDAMGHARFLLFYLACGVLAALAQEIGRASCRERVCQYE